MNTSAESRSANSRGHRNAPLTPEGRLRLCLRIDAGRPIAHIAAEAGISRRCLAKWYARWRAHGENGLLDHSSRPATSPARTLEDTADLVEALRRQTKHGPARLAADLQRLHGITPIRRCLTDNGACCRSTIWADALAATGTKHKRTRPYTPRTNGKVERCDGTLSREWAYVRDYTAERERRVALAEFVNYDNHERPTARQPDRRERLPNRLRPAA